MTQELQNKIEEVIRRHPQADDREMLFHFKQLLYEAETQYPLKESKSITDLVDGNVSQIMGEAAQNAMIKTGFDDLDRAIGGFGVSEFVVIGGRPSMGKTQFLVNLSLHISTTVPVLYISLDLSEFLLTNRFVSAVSNIPGHTLLERNLSEEQKSRLSALSSEFSKRQLFIHDSDNSISAIQAHCKREIQQKGIAVIVVDYLQLMSAHQYRQRYTRDLEVGFICRELKRMAKEHNVCVIVSSQLNRSVENRGGPRIPQLSDLRESGAIEQDADKVVFIHRPEYYGITIDEEGNSLLNMAEIFVAKNRNGRLCRFYLSVDKDFTNFRNLNPKKDFAFSPNRLMELEVGDLPPF